jgi:DNA-binding transcriptional regulator YiaG
VEFTFDHARIRIIREEKGLSQGAFGKTVRRSRSAVSQWEDGVCTPTIPTLLEICRTHGVEPGNFFVPKNTYL